MMCVNSVTLLSQSDLRLCVYAAVKSTPSAPVAVTNRNRDRDRDRDHERDHDRERDHSDNSVN
jgi:hypothetical protein